MIKRMFTFHGHEIIHHQNALGECHEIEAPCSVPLTIANAFDFMIHNGVHSLVVDGVEIRRTM